MTLVLAALMQQPAAPPAPPPGPAALEVGAQAPDFAIPGATRYGTLKNPARLSDYKGRRWYSRSSSKRERVAERFK